MTRLVLASASPRRREILRSRGIVFEIHPVSLDETPLAGEAPERTAVRLALAKARLAAGAAFPAPEEAAVAGGPALAPTVNERGVGPARGVPTGAQATDAGGDAGPQPRPANPHGSLSVFPPGRPETLILGADTIVVLDGGLLGKPADASEAAGMLARLSGREHVVMTGLALLDPRGRREESAVSRTLVRFARLSRAQIDDYIATGVPFDKAGAYGIQEPATWFVDEVDGSYSNVVGLPIELLEESLGRFGLRLEDFARP
jgi:predicted house-cleaning NTP pyrophosphatase (Maf/HAM1 superfamily)